VGIFGHSTQTGVREQTLPNPSNIYLLEAEAKHANPYIFLLVIHCADLRKERTLPTKQIYKGSSLTANSLQNLLLGDYSQKLPRI
jgi:hypothetical protein